MSSSICLGCDWVNGTIDQVSVWSCSPDFESDFHWRCKTSENIINCSWSNEPQSCLFCSPGQIFANSTKNCTTVETNSFILPWWRQMIWYFLFATMVVVSVAGNVIVIWIVMSQKKMRTVTNYFIVNLSIADTMVSSLNVTFNFVYMLNGHWPFGEIYCKVSSFISIISVCGSVFTLVAISIDRYNAIIRPLRPRLSRLTTILIAMSIWVVGTAIAMPQLLYFTTTQAPAEDRVICYGEWPDGKMNESYIEYVYNVCFMILTYFLPMMLMTATYAKIGLELWGSKVIGETTVVQMENIKSKRRVVKMMIIVVVIFGVCWAPYHAYFIFANIFPQINFTTYIQELYLSIYWIAMSNSMYNPMIYCFMNNRFRQGFLQVYRCFFGCCVGPNGCCFKKNSEAEDLPIGDLNPVSEFRANSSGMMTKTPTTCNDNFSSPATLNNSQYSLKYPRNSRHLHAIRTNSMRDNMEMRSYPPTSQYL